MLLTIVIDQYRFFSYYSNASNNIFLTTQNVHFLMFLTLSKLKPVTYFHSFQPTLTKRIKNVPYMRFHEYHIYLFPIWCCPLFRSWHVAAGNLPSVQYVARAIPNVFVFVMWKVQCSKISIRLVFVRPYLKWYAMRSLFFVGIEELFKIGSHLALCLYMKSGLFLF